MSRYAWERGTITLPSADVARVKKAVRDATNALHERRYQRARELWRKHGAELRRTKDAYAVFSVAENDFDALHTLLERAAYEGRMPRRSDVRPERATNKTSVFPVGDEAAIYFDGRQVTWSVPENNHAVERAREDPVARAFFAALGRVRWTRGSGGQIVGNDEYNRDADYAGGGGNYVTATYGPPAARARARRGLGR